MKSNLNLKMNWFFFADSVGIRYDLFGSLGFFQFHKKPLLTFVSSFLMDSIRLSQDSHSFIQKY